MADDVELFIFTPAQLASQKSEFFEEVYFRRRTCNGNLQFGFKHGGRVIVPVFLEFTGRHIQKCEPTPTRWPGTIELKYMFVVSCHCSSLSRKKRDYARVTTRIFPPPFL